jgi:potassium-transporting ATPase ATP-binding subunit
MQSSATRKGLAVATLLDAKIVWPAVGSAFVKLDPRTLVKNPVIFVLEIVTVLTTVILVRDLLLGADRVGFEFQIVLWLWFTVLFANFAEGSRRAAARLRPTRCGGSAPRRRRNCSGPAARGTTSSCQAPA